MNCLDSNKYVKTVEENDKFAKNIGLQSTPTFLIFKDNSTRIAAIEGHQPLIIFEDVIDQLLNNT